MKAASISEIKQELAKVPAKELLALCLKMAKYKKENKELLSFLLFESDDVDQYVVAIKEEIDDSISEINTSNLYLIKKSLRKILRNTNKYIKYTSSDEVGAEVLIYFCNAVKSQGFKINRSTALQNLYSGQIKKIHSLIKNLEEDLQHDFLKKTEGLEL